MSERHWIFVSGLVAGLALSGCAATFVDGPQPDPEDLASIEVAPRVRSVVIEGRRSLSGEFEARPGTYEVAATAVGDVRPLGVRGPSFRLVYDCVSAIRFDSGADYRLQSRPGSQLRIAAPDAPEGEEPIEVYGVVLEVLAAPEYDPIARIDCGEPSVYTMPVTYSFSNTFQ